MTGQQPLKDPGSTPDVPPTEPDQPAPTPDAPPPVTEPTTAPNPAPGTWDDPQPRSVPAGDG